MLFQSNYGVIEQDGLKFAEFDEQGNTRVLDIKAEKSGEKFIIKGYTFRILLKGKENTIICRDKDGRSCAITDSLMKELCSDTKLRQEAEKRVVNACNELVKCTCYSPDVDRCMSELARVSFLYGEEITVSFTQKIAKAMTHGARLRSELRNTASGER